MKDRYAVKLSESCADPGFKFSVFADTIREARKERTLMARGNGLPSCEIDIYDTVKKVYVK